MKKHRNVETSELLQMYSNADVTCGCGGHYKASQNERLRKEYAEELSDRGINVPATLSQKLSKSFVCNVDVPKGVFNGKGSY